MFSLIALGTGAAYLYSLVAVLAPQLFPSSTRTHSGYPAMYFEPAAVIVALVLMGQVLELAAPTPHQWSHPSSAESCT